MWFPTVQLHVKSKEAGTDSQRKAHCSKWKVWGDADPIREVKDCAASATPAPDTSGADPATAAPTPPIPVVDKCKGKTCAAPKVCHVAGRCDADSGVCTDPLAPNGDECDDKDSKTTDDVCSDGVCAGVDHCLGVTCPDAPACHKPGMCEAGECTELGSSCGSLGGAEHCSV